MLILTKPPLSILVLCDSRFKIVQYDIKSKDQTSCSNFL